MNWRNKGISGHKRNDKNTQQTQAFLAMNTWISSLIGKGGTEQTIHVETPESFNEPQGVSNRVIFVWASTWATAVPDYAPPSMYRIVAKPFPWQTPVSMSQLPFNLKEPPPPPFS